MDGLPHMESSDRITVTIPEFLKSSGVGRSKTYELIEAGEIKSVLVGRRRLIVVQSYLDYLARQMQQQAAGIGRIASPNPRSRRSTASALSGS